MEAAVVQVAFGPERAFVGSRRLQLTYVGRLPVVADERLRRGWRDHGATDATKPLKGQKKRASAATPVVKPRLPARLGEYRVLRRLGHGERSSPRRGGRQVVLSS